MQNLKGFAKASDGHLKWLFEAPGRISDVSLSLGKQLFRVLRDCTSQFPTSPSLMGCHVIKWGHEYSFWIVRLQVIQSIWIIFYVLVEYGDPRVMSDEDSMRCHWNVHLDFGCRWNVNLELGCRRNLWIIIVSESGCRNDCTCQVDPSGSWLARQTGAKLCSTRISSPCGRHRCSRDSRADLRADYSDRVFVKTRVIIVVVVVVWGGGAWGLGH